jgi:hypothetical protein
VEAVLQKHTPKYSLGIISSSAKMHVDFTSRQNYNIFARYRSVELAAYFRYRNKERRLCITLRGYLGLVPYEICIFQGCDGPFVLRKTGNFRALIGDAYIHWMMPSEGLGLDVMQNILLG